MVQCVCETINEKSVYCVLTVEFGILIAKETYLSTLDFLWNKNAAVVFFWVLLFLFIKIFTFLFKIRLLDIFYQPWLILGGHERLS